MFPVPSTMLLVAHHDHGNLDLGDKHFDAAEDPAEMSHVGYI